MADVGHERVEDDQLLLAMRPATLGQLVVTGTNCPFLADDLFVNFDDARTVTGFEAQAEIARWMKIPLFSHHPHLAAFAW